MTSRHPVWVFADITCIQTRLCIGAQCPRRRIREALEGILLTVRLSTAFSAIPC